MAVQCFKLLHELVDKMEDGDEIVFADEYGTWMITGDEKRFVKSFLSSLAAISKGIEFIFVKNAPSDQKKKSKKLNRDKKFIIFLANLIFPKRILPD
jgi:hypothetical protein